MRLNDKVAIITGTSRDIDQRIVKRFSEGVKVVLVAKNLKTRRDQETSRKHTVNCISFM